MCVLARLSSLLPPTVVVLALGAALTPPALSEQLPFLFLQETPSGPFHARAAGFSVRLEPQGVTLSSQGAALRMDFAGAPATVRVEGERPSAARVNLLYGSDPGGWQTGLPAFEGVILRGLYPGVDYRFSQDAGRLKSEFIVAPGASPADIRLRYSDATRLSIDADGNLLAEKDGRIWKEDAPLVYEQAPSGRRPVLGRFVLLDEYTVAFEIGPRDATLSLVIDPTLTFSTLLGSSGSAYATSIAHDANGLVYVAGYTDGYNFPSQGQSFPRAGGVDVVVAKIDPRNSQLLYATYIGGWGDDRAYGVAVDASGQVLLTGTTTSTNFPVASAYQNAIHGYKDAFLLKLNPSTGTLVFSTYYGGTGSDSAKALALSSTGSIYIAGETDSWDLPFPAGFRRTSNGATDAFVARFTPSGQLDAATYYGGGGNDRARALALDPSGNAWIGGSTDSINLATVAPFQSALRGTMDGFLAKFDSSLATLVTGTYLGGSQGSPGMPEEVLAVAVDSAGAVFAAGVTPSSDFPLRNPAQSIFGGESDAWLAKLNSAGSALTFSTFLGGSNYDSAAAVALDAGGRVHVAGQTYSPNFLTNQAIQPALAGWIDAFLASFDAATGALSFSTFLGGTGADIATAIVPGWAGHVYVAGATGSAEFPQYHPIQLAQGASLRFFVTEVTYPTLARPQVVSISPTSGSGSSQTFTFRFRHPDGIQALYFIHWMINSPFGGRNACYGAYIQGGNVLQLTSDQESMWPSIQLGTTQTLSNSQCTIHAQGSSAVESGTDLVLTLNVSFAPAFAGMRKVWLHAVDDTWKDSGFVEVGSFNVAFSGGLDGSPAPQASVSPSAGTGSGETFSFDFPFPQGVSDLDTAYALFNSSPSAAYGCLVAWRRATNLLYLVADDGVAWLPAVRPGTSDSAANSQCTLSSIGFQTSLGTSARSMQVTVVFKDSLPAPLPVYARAIFAGGLDSGFQTVGSYTVAVRHEPMVVSVTPGEGSGTAQAFAIRIRHPDGIRALYFTHLLLNGSFSGSNACYVAYIQGAGILQLAGDNELLWPSIPIGSNQSLSNSQCTLSGSGASALESGTELLLNVPVAFKPVFTGPRKIWLHAVSRTWQDSGFIQKGLFTVR
jgi:hypothetical protein